MPTVEELRAWLQGRKVEGLPRPPGNLAKCEFCKGEKKVRIGEAVQPINCPRCGGEGEVLPEENKTSPMVERMKERKERYERKKNGGKYTISVDGCDAFLHFGKHKGRTVSEIASRYPKYIDWMLEQEFPSDLKDVCRYQRDHCVPVGPPYDDDVPF